MHIPNPLHAHAMHKAQRNQHVWHLIIHTTDKQGSLQLLYGSIDLDQLSLKHQGGTCMLHGMKRVKLALPVSPAATLLPCNQQSVPPTARDLGGRARVAVALQGQRKKHTDGRKVKGSRQ